MKIKTISLNVLKNILNALAVLAIAVVASLVFNGFTQLVKEQLYLSSIIGTIIYLTVILGLGTLYIKKVLKMNLSEVGLSFFSVKSMGKKNIFWSFFGILIPCLVLAIYFIFVPGSFVFNKNANVSQTIVFAVFQIGLRAGIGEEFLFRGILFRYMKKTLGTVAAVLIPSIVFGAIHIFNMTEFNAVDVIQLLIGGTAVAMMFSLIALKTGSLVPGMFLHSCWNILIIGSIFGIGDIVNGVENTSIIQYRLESANHLLTGGNFGIEVALPAIAVYVCACIFIFILIKKVNNNKPSM